MNKRLNIDYGAIHASYWMFYGVSLSFASAFLLHADYTNGEIGIILAAGNVIAVFLQPLIADLADRAKRISLIGVIEICTVLLIIMQGSLFVLRHKSAALWVMFALMVAWMTTVHPLINSLSFKLEEAGVHINFGICRSMGSLCYSIICGILGSLVQRYGAEVLPAAGEFTLLALLAALLLVGVHFRKACVRKQPQPQKEDGIANTDEITASDENQDENINLLAFLRDNRMFAMMQLGVATLYFHNSILNNFMLQIVEGVGGSSADMGRVLSVMAFLEIPALFFFDKLHQRFSCEFMLKLAAICFAMKIFLIYMAKDITLIYAAHLLQPFSFALFLPAMVAFINEIMRKGEAVKGQACYTMMTTVSSIIASVAGGILLDTAGDKAMLLVSTLLTAVGAAVVLLLIGKIKRKQEND